MIGYSARNVGVELLRKMDEDRLLRMNSKTGGQKLMIKRLIRSSTGYGLCLTMDATALLK